MKPRTDHNELRLGIPPSVKVFGWVEIVFCFVFGAASWQHGDWTGAVVASMFSLLGVFILIYHGVLEINPEFITTEVYGRPTG